MNKWNVLFILLLFFQGGSMELFSQCCKPVVIRKTTANASTSRFQQIKVRKFSAGGGASCSEVRQYVQGVISRKQRSIRIKNRNKMPSSHPGGNKVNIPGQKKYSLQGSKSLETLRKIHSLQLQIVRNGRNLSFREQQDLFSSILSLRKELEIPLRQIRNFPHEQSFTSLEAYLEKLYKKDRGLVSKEKHLLHIQKLQLKSLKNHLSGTSSSRQTAGKRV